MRLFVLIPAFILTLCLHNQNQRKTGSAKGQEKTQQTSQFRRRHCFLVNDAPEPQMQQTVKSKGRNKLNNDITSELVQTRPPYDNLSFLDKQSLGAFTKWHIPSKNKQIYPIGQLYLHKLQFQIDCPQYSGTLIFASTGIVTKFILNQHQIKLQSLLGQTTLFDSINEIPFQSYQIKCGKNQLKVGVQNQQFSSPLAFIFKIWQPSEGCQCVCDNVLTCPVDSLWDDFSCSCNCLTKVDCPEMKEWDQDNCECKCKEDCFEPRILNHLTCSCICPQNCSKGDQNQQTCECLHKISEQNIQKAIEENQSGERVQDD